MRDLKGNRGGRSSMFRICQFWRRPSGTQGTHPNVMPARGRDPDSAVNMLNRGPDGLCVAESFGGRWAGREIVRGLT